MESPKDVALIENALKRAREYHLEAEVVWSAMREYEKFHRHSPETYDFEWALDVALNDWDIPPSDTGGAF